MHSGNSSWPIGLLLGEFTEMGHYYPLFKREWASIFIPFSFLFQTSSSSFFLKKKLLFSLCFEVDGVMGLAESFNRFAPEYGSLLFWSYVLAFWAIVEGLRAGTLAFHKAQYPQRYFCYRNGSALN